MGFFEDLFSGLVKQVTAAVESKAKKSVEDFERVVRVKARQLKRKFVAGMLQMFLFAVGVGFLFAGLIMLFDRFFALDLVLIVAALVVFYLGLLIAWMYR